ncbi:EAL domain-containing protein [Niveispirillum fermenti]|uniref:EAL domain-containing protein n=1 Tax=Niveispirillum fermenti TaxID=1233113 RepID=UPI003A89B41C
MPKTARYLGFAFANSDLLLEVDLGGRITFLAGAVQALTGRTDDNVRGLALRDLLSDADARLALRLLTDLGENERLEPRLIHLRHPLLGETPCVMGAYRVLGRASISVTFSRLAGRDGTRSFKPSECDVETGLSSQASFQKYLSGLEMGEGDSRHLTLIRLAELREMCAELVPAQASELLAEIGAVLRQHAPSDAAVARLGPDRFGMLHTEDVVSEIRGEIDDVVRALVPDSNGTTIDIQTLDTEGLGLSMPDRVRILLHVVRRFAEKGLVSFDPQGGRPLVTSLVQETVQQMLSLRDDLLAKRIGLAYQPIIDLRTGRTHHVEALARKPDGTSYAPGIAFAEQVGVVADFDLFVCRKVLHDLEKAPAGHRVAVNLSGHSIGSDLFVQALVEMLRARPVEAARVLFELTETVGLKDLPRAGRIIADLRGAGHAVCLDDFGAGVASFPYLRDMKFDYVKLDGSYIRNLGRSERDDAILGSMMGLCRRLKVKTIAEHVETVEQAVRLRSLRCDLAQGWLFGAGTNRLEYQQFDINKLNQPGQWHSQLRVQ